MVIGSSNVPLRYERKGRGAMPPRPARRDGASEAKSALNMWLALRVGRVVHDHKDCKLWAIVQEVLPKGSYRGAGLLGVADRADRAVR